MRLEKQDLDRFLKNVLQGADCWDWIGSKNSVGYGQFAYQGGPKLAHRLAYGTWVGELVPGKFVCHTCDNRACVNPKHLFQGSPKWNSKDSISKGRFKLPKSRLGEEHPDAKLSVAAVIDIRSASPKRGYVMRLARQYGVSHKVVNQVRSRKTWKGLHNGFPSCFYIKEQE